MFLALIQGRLLYPEHLLRLLPDSYGYDGWRQLNDLKFLAKSRTALRNEVTTLRFS